MANLDVPDINVWLALSDPDHQHHSRARFYWETQSAREIAFCRVTMLGLLRLLTHSKVMAGQPFSVTEALAAYEAFIALPEICFVEDSPLAESLFFQWAKASDFRPRHWTDLWIAALAHAAGARVISFDSDFSQWNNLNFLHLKP
jgi:hypothetical protein